MPELTIERLIYWLLLVVSLTIHEWAHAWAAYKLGDDTAERMGRLTFNPLVHIDLLGTVILPLLGVPFGWAKPVPVRPECFDRKYSPSLGMMLVAIAGPISNLIQAVVGAALWMQLPRLMHLSPDFFQQLHVTLSLYIMLNVALAIFNMIPIPPLDGSRVVNHFLPWSMREKWAQLEQFGPLLVMGLFLMMRSVNPGFLNGPIVWVMSWIIWLVSPLGM